MKRSIIAGIHITYWIGCFLLLLFVFSLIRLSAKGETDVPFFFKMITGFAFVPGMFSFYVFYMILFPRFLQRKKIGLLFFYGILISITGGLLGEIFLTLAIGGVGNNKGEYIFPNYEMSEIFIALFLTTIVSTVNGIIGIVIKGFITSYGDIKLKEELNKKNYEVELALMKAQINPHFLFNTINNIDVLIEKDAAKASVYLNKLSDIMRFMLYETKTEKITLVKELAYIEKYIDLQKIRTAKPESINYLVNGEAKNLMIEPMLFIPFIENAFKHSESVKQRRN